MKTKSFVQTLVSRSNIAVVLGVLLAVFGSTPVAHAASAAELLEKGIYTEMTKGDLKTATEIYREITDDPRAERGLIAQAQLRLGLCQLKLGNKPQAVIALDRLTQEFPDKDKLLAIVEQQMPQVLNEMMQQIERNYIQEVDPGDLMETAIRAIVGKLDARGGFLRTNDMEFLGTKQLRDFDIELEQKVVGIGAVLKAEAGEVVVRTPLPGSPAIDAGIQAEDRIITIDGTRLPPNQLATAVEMLRGSAGTTVTLGLKRPGADELRELTLTRNTIRLPNVSGHRRRPDNTWDFMLDDEKKIGYLRLAYIGKQSAEEMRVALNDLESRGMKALIFDLRNNPGGLLDGAVAISDLFVDSGRIVTVKSRKEQTAYDAKAEGTFSGFSMALLVNRRTASAAEIIAGCLQDHQRAVVMGERTFGQGIVRSIFKLKSGVGAIKLPVAAYYRPNGKSVNRYPDSKDSDDWGITPDAGFELVLSDEELKQYDNYQAARTAFNGETVSKVNFQDAQMQMALDWIVERLGNK